MEVFRSERMDAMLKAPWAERGRADRFIPDKQGALDEGAAKVEARNFDNARTSSNSVQWDERSAQGHFGAKTGAKIEWARNSLEAGRNCRNGGRQSGPSTILVTKGMFPRRLSRGLGHPGSKEGGSRAAEPWICRSPIGAREEGHRRRGNERARCTRRPTRPMPSGSAATRPRRCAMSKSRSSCKRSLISGATIWSHSITFARVIGWRGLAQRDPAQRI